MALKKTELQKQLQKKRVILQHSGIRICSARKESTNLKSLSSHKTTINLKNDIKNTVDTGKNVALPPKAFPVKNVQISNSKNVIKNTTSNTNQPPVKTATSVNFKSKNTVKSSSVEPKILKKVTVCKSLQQKHCGIPISPKNKKNPYITPQITHSRKKIIIKDAKHSGVHITPKPKITLFKAPSVRGHEKEKLDNICEIPGISPLKESDKNTVVEKDANMYSGHDDRIQDSNDSSVKEQQLTRESSTEGDSLFSTLASFKNYVEFCETVDKEKDDTIERYEKLLDNYESYYDELLKFVACFVNDLKDLWRTNETCNEGDFAGDIETPTLNENNYQHMIDKLKTQNSALEKKLAASNRKYHKLQIHLDSATYDSISNVVTFEEIVMQSLDLIQKKLQKDKDDHFQLLIDKENEIQALSDKLAECKLKLQESNDTLATVSAEKENLEQIVKFRFAARTMMSFSEIVNELVFTTCNNDNSNINDDIEYKAFYQQLLDFITALKDSVKLLGLDCYLSLPAVQYCNRCKDIAALQQQNDEQIDSVSVPDEKNSDLSVHTLKEPTADNEKLMRLIELLLDNVRQLKNEENAPISDSKYNSDEFYRCQLLTVLFDQNDNSACAADDKLSDAYCELMKQLLELKATKVKKSTTVERSVSDKSIRSKSLKMRDLNNILSPIDGLNYSNTMENSFFSAVQKSPKFGRMKNKCELFSPDFEDSNKENEINMKGKNEIFEFKPSRESISMNGINLFM